MIPFSKDGRFLSSLIASILAVASAGIFMCCQSSETIRSAMGSEMPTPRDFRLLMGEGGGFTGLWNGYLVDSTGAVFSWRGTMPGQNATRTATLARPEFEKLWQTIVDARFFDIDTTGTGNITLMMQVTASGRMHYASWAKPAEIRQRLAPVHVLYDSCRAIVSRGK